MICWSAIWISPKEIESRLTVTIVCLLSLIAYNFVIDSELPKLEYLTIMDWIIFTSYIFAAIPNFLCTISFKLYSSNKQLCMAIENKSKYLGPLLYLLIVLSIILVNVNLQPDTEALEEVVVVGYGTVLKRDLTGSVSSVKVEDDVSRACLLYTSPSPRDGLLSRMPSSA